MPIVSPRMPAQTLLRPLAKLLLISSLFAGVEAKAACTATGACLSAGPPLASIDTGQSDCEVSSTPAVGASGNVEWTFRGTLLPGASGTVTMDVLVQ